MKKTSLLFFSILLILELVSCEVLFPTSGNAANLKKDTLIAARAIIAASSKEERQTITSASHFLDKVRKDFHSTIFQNHSISRVREGKMPLKYFYWHHTDKLSPQEWGNPTLTMHIANNASPSDRKKLHQILKTYKAKVKTLNKNTFTLTTDEPGFVDFYLTISKAKESKVLSISQIRRPLSFSNAIKSAISKIGIDTYDIIKAIPPIPSNAQ